MWNISHTHSAIQKKKKKNDFVKLVQMHMVCSCTDTAIYASHNVVTKYQKVLIKTWARTWYLQKYGVATKMWPALEKQGTSRKADVSHFTCTVWLISALPYAFSQTQRSSSITKQHRALMMFIHEWLLLQ